MKTLRHRWLPLLFCGTFMAVVAAGIVYVQLNQFDIHEHSDTSTQLNAGAASSLQSSAVSTTGFVRMSEETPPSLSAHAVAVVDASSSEVLYATQEKNRWPLASITKLMTAVIAFRDMSLSKPIVVSVLHNPASSTSAVADGDVFSLRDLLAIMLVSSNNDAAQAISQAYGQEKFVAAMNQQAAAWGLTDTFFEEPTGLSVSNQSTAADVVLLVSHILREYPDIFSLTQKKSIAAVELQSGVLHRAFSTNQFAGTAGFFGGKTGFTDEAEGNLVSLFLVKSRPLIIVTLGTKDRFGETQKLREWVERTFTLHP